MINGVESAFILFRVYSTIQKQREMVGQIAVPVSLMREGYRNIQLLDKDFKTIDGSKLLCLIEMNWVDE